MKKKNVLSAVLLLLIGCMLIFGLIACHIETKESPINSGIKGIALIGPVQPVSKPNETNEKPYIDAVIVVRNLTNKEEISRTKVENDGTFKINLSPGRYLLEPVNSEGSKLPFAPSMEVAVLANQYTDVTVNFDSGIR